jgi:hypothetical protein
MLESFAAWLARTPLSAFVAGEAWVVPTVQTVHILAIAIVMGSVAIVHLRVLGLVERRQSIGALAARFVPPSIAAIIVLAITGFLMIASEPTRALFRYVFWAKMTLLLVAIALTAVLLAGLRASGAADTAGKAAPVPYRMLAVLVLLIWLAIIVTGRWIGYAQGWPGAPDA